MKDGGRKKDGNDIDCDLEDRKSRMNDIGMYSVVKSKKVRPSGRRDCGDWRIRVSTLKTGR